MDRNREFPRTETTVTVKYATIDQLVVAYTKDLSKGGMFLSTRQFLPVNAVLRVELELPFAGGTVPLICRVVFVRDPDEAVKTGKPPGMGLEFLDAAKEELARIEEFLTSADAKGGSEKGAIGPTRRALRVLVVDDDPTLRAFAAEPFIARGDDVRTAADGLEGLGLCLKSPPDVLLTDVQMPRIDGWQLLRMVRSRPTLGSMAVVFLTTLGGESDRLQGYRLGVDDYVPKPCHPQELLVRVDRVVARGQGGGRSQIDRKTLRGDLEHVALSSVLTFLAIERNTGVLFVLGPKTARIFFSDGNPLRVDIDDAPVETTSRTLLFEVLSWREGQFEFAIQDVGCGDELHASVAALLLDYAQAVDEAAQSSGEHAPETKS
jgi:uncharacterized protein (TIGR02266 family)